MGTLNQNNNLFEIHNLVLGTLLYSNLGHVASVKLTPLQDGATKAMASTMRDRSKQMVGILHCRHRVELGVPPLTLAGGSQLLAATSGGASR